ncbi:hypothetical protein [Scytonema sp. NUACC26]|uniref:hypothetical protein n=1 Tax=Scytonema sp. NUACC26 TaxID=3140176 RepID=UPI0034DC7664
MNTNRYEKESIEEFITIIDRSFPEVKELLNHCYVKLIQSFCGQESSYFLPYIAIYSPNNMIAAVKAQMPVFKIVAKYVGIFEVVCINATCLLHHPMSKLKQDNPHLWLELHWITTRERGNV